MAYDSRSRSPARTGGEGPVHQHDERIDKTACLETALSLGEDGKSCTVCKGSASSACVAAWLKSECTPLENIDGRNFRPPPGQRIHIAGGWAHPSHAIGYHAALGIWYCAKCGFFGQSQLRGLGKPCQPDLITKNSQEYLDRVSRDLFPKV